MKIFILACLMVATTAMAGECPWEKPYKCKNVGYMQYQCGCGVEWTQSRAGRNSQNPYLTIMPPTTVIVNQPYTEPRYIRYDGQYAVSHSTFMRK